MGTSTDIRFRGRPRPPAPVMREKPPGVFEALRLLRSNPIEALSRTHFERPIVVTKTLIGTFVVVSEPGTIQHVLVANAANYRRERIQQRMMELPFGPSVLEAESDQWRIQRRRIAPGFTPKVIADFATEMAGAASALAKRWSSLEEGTRLDLCHEMDQAMMEGMGRTLFPDGFGRDPKEILTRVTLHYELTARVNPFDVLNLPAWFPRPAQSRRRRGLAYFAEMAESMIEARERQLRTSSFAPPNDLLTILLGSDDEETDALSRTEVVANIFTLLVAGYPITSALVFTLYLLALDPEWRTNVELEVDRELPEGRFVEGSLPRLVATRAALEETLRLYPSIPTIHRQAIAADRLGDQPIEPGTVVVVSPWVLHRHRLLWEAPDDFDPSRFLSPAREKIDRFAYLPFGAGPRICIGASYSLQQAIIMLATIVRTFQLEVAPGYQMRPVHRVTLRPEGGLPMILRRRRRS